MRRSRPRPPIRARDVWWGGPGDPHMQAAEEGLLAEYKSPRLGELHDWAQQLAEQSKFRTSGIYLGALGIGYNTEVLKQEGHAGAEVLGRPARCQIQGRGAGLRSELRPAPPM